VAGKIGREGPSAGWGRAEMEPGAGAEGPGRGGAGPESGGGWTGTGPESGGGPDRSRARPGWLDDLPRAFLAGGDEIVMFGDAGRRGGLSGFGG
jgi:hypothetical protein